MNDQTYTLLRQVASDIRQPALESGRTVFALDGLAKAAAFLAAEVHLHGDVALAQRADYAVALREAASLVWEPVTVPQPEEEPPEDALAEEFIDHARNPEYVAQVLEHAAQLMREGDAATARGLVLLTASAFKIRNERDEEINLPNPKDGVTS
jgi:hypothetical protein